MTAAINVKSIVLAYQNALSRLIILDYDGTLVPFNNHPDKIKSSEDVEGLLKLLSSDHKNKIILISGRTRKDLDTLCDGMPVILGAEHGAYMKDQSGWIPLAPQSTPWMMRVSRALNELALKYRGSFVEPKEFSAAWHYRAIADTITENDLGQILENLRLLAKYTGCRLDHCEYTIELRTPGIDKGAAVSRWMGNKRFDFIMALGDSLTDEDLFEALDHRAYSIRVGKSSASSACFHLSTQKDVIPFLQSLSGEKEHEVEVLI
jgi:trehalose 6-phosphate synthase/phosphatase